MINSDCYKFIPVLYSRAYLYFERFKHDYNHSYNRFYTGCKVSVANPNHDHNMKDVGQKTTSTVFYKKKKKKFWCSAEADRQQSLLVKSSGYFSGLQS